MAIDEDLSFHERLVKPVREILGSDSLGIFHFAWVVPGVAITIAIGTFFFIFLMHLPAKTRRHFLLAAGLYVAGAIGMELVGGYFTELSGKDNFRYRLSAFVEETLEMAGVIVFIESLLAYLANNYHDVRFDLSNR